MSIEEICIDEGVECIYDLPLLDSRDDHSRLALSDGENSIWVCDHCGELHDPDDDDGICECQEENEDD